MIHPQTVFLLPHPSTPCPAVHALEVVVVRCPGGGLDLDYRIHGEIAQLRVAEEMSRQRADQLWQHTCCEAFVATARGGTAYHEFNFAPSGAWAAYAFSAMRVRDAPSDPPTTAAPTISLTRSEKMLSLAVFLPAELLPAEHSLVLGLSAVVEDADGSLSYWAQRHLAAAPDFHLRDSFALSLDLAP